jgi:hypothetical protein
MKDTVKLEINKVLYDGLVEYAEHWGQGAGHKLPLQDVLALSFSFLKSFEAVVRYDDDLVTVPYLQGVCIEHAKEEFPWLCDSFFKED